MRWDLTSRGLGLASAGSWARGGFGIQSLGLGLSAATGFRLHGGKRSDSWVWAFCYYVSEGFEGQGFSGFAINSDFRGQDLECVV